MDAELAEGVEAMIAERKDARTAEWERGKATTARLRAEQQKARAASLRRRQADRLARNRTG